MNGPAGQSEGERILGEALEWYANPNNLTEFGPKDLGARARSALMFAGVISAEGEGEGRVYEGECVRVVPVDGPTA